MTEENISQEFRPKNTNATGNYIKLYYQNELMTKKHKSVCGVFNYNELLPILVSTVTGCVSCFASLVGIPVGITSSAVGLKIWVTIEVIKKHKSIIETKKKKHDIIVLLAKSKLNSIEVLVNKSLFDSHITHVEFV